MRWNLTIERRMIRHLQGEIEYWRALYREERNRAEMAIDACRMHHAQLPPVSLRPTDAGLPKDLQELMSQPELGLIGNETGA